MAIDLTVPTALRYFASLVHSDEGFPLLEAAVSLAQDEWPGLDTQQVLGAVDHLLWRLQHRLAQDAPAVQRLRVLNRFFFGTLGFSGNVNDYHAPHNSYVHEVLRTRRGNSASLAVLWLELALGVGLKAQGVAFAGYFLVRVLLADGQVLMDPLTGQSLSREELIERLAPLPHAMQALQENTAALGELLRPAEPREILAHLLRCLKAEYCAHQEWPRALAVQNRLVLLLPHDGAAVRDRGLAHAACGHVALAVQDLQAYLALCPDALDAKAMAECIQNLNKNSL